MVRATSDTSPELRRDKIAKGAPNWHIIFLAKALAKVLVLESGIGIAIKYLVRLLTLSG